MTTYVCYHIPSDRDEEEHPNAFAIHKPAEEVTLLDVKKAFPLPGEYHFRFKVKIDSGSYWVDFTQNDACVPTWGPRRIVAKVLRISWQQKAVPKPVPPPERLPTPQTVVNNHVDLFGGSSPPRQSGQTSNGVTELDLFS